MKTNKEGIIVQLYPNEMSLEKIENYLKMFIDQHGEEKVYGIILPYYDKVKDNETKIKFDIDEIEKMIANYNVSYTILPINHAIEAGERMLNPMTDERLEVLKVKVREMILNDYALSMNFKPVNFNDYKE